MQTSGAEQANRHASKHCIHHDKWCDTVRDLLLNSHIPASSVLLHKVDDTGAGRSHPSCMDETEKNPYMSSQERNGQFAGQKHILAKESPIDSPFEEELSTKVECTAQILSTLAFDEERKRTRKLDSLQLANAAALGAYMPEPVAVARAFQLIPLGSSQHLEAG